MKAPTLSPLERRCGAQRVDLAAFAEARSADCAACGGVYLDIPDGRDAHQVVFGHQPSSGEPAREEHDAS